MSALSRFSGWQPAPPADPDFLRRVRRFRWEKGLVALVMGSIWATFIYVLIMVKHFVGAGSLVNPMIMITTAGWLYTRSRRAAPHIADLLDLPATFPQFPVEVSYRLSSGAPYGADEGILSFVDGWLHFQGRRTSWSLAANGSPKTNKGVKVSKQEGGPYGGNLTRAITWGDGERDYKILVLPMDRLEGVGTGLRKRFNAALDRWSRSEAADSGREILPPVQVSPEAMLAFDRKLRLAYFVGGLDVGALAVQFALFSFASTIWIWALVVTLAMVVAFGWRQVWCLQNVWSRCRNTEMTAPSQSRPSVEAQFAYAFQAATRRVRSRWLKNELAASRPAHEALPVELRYEFPLGEFRREVGWLSTDAGRICFRGRYGNWAVSAWEASHFDGDLENWRICFEKPLPCDQVLVWKAPGPEVRIRIRPLTVRGEGALETAAKLKTMLAELAAPVLPQEPVGPPMEPERGRIPRLNSALKTWSVLAVLFHLIWFGAILTLCALAFESWQIGAAVCIAGIAGAVVATQRRAWANKALRATFLALERQRELSYS